jgi:hypothetical protein
MTIAATQSDRLPGFQLNKAFTYLCLAATLIGLPNAGWCSAIAAPESIEIQAGNNDSRGQILIRLPRDASTSVGLTLTSKNGKCIGYIGRDEAAIDMQLPSPCDVMTRGALDGFTPRVVIKKTGKLSETMTFQVVGGLRYFPLLRSECSHQFRDIELKAQITNGKPSMTISVGPLGGKYPDPNGAVHCPRWFVDVKPSNLP